MDNSGLPMSVTAHDAGAALTICQRLSAQLWPGGRESAAASPPPARIVRTARKRRETAQARRERLGWADAHELLDALDEVFNALKLRRDCGNEGIRFLDRVGATLIPNGGGHLFDRTDVFAYGKTLPSEMMIAISRADMRDSPEDRVGIPLWWATKVSSPPSHVLRLRDVGAYYLVRGLHEGFKTLRKSNGKLEAFGVYVAVTADGEVIGLPEVRKSRVRIRRARAQERWTEVNSPWIYPNSKPPGQTPEQGDTWTWKDFFACMVQVFALRDSGIQVRVSRAGRTLVVPVPLNDAKEFFSKRIDVKTAAGRNRPIFHWVASHTRKSGSTVKTHTRGSQNFVWNGYSVSIRLPKRDIQMLTSFDIESVEEHDVGGLGYENTVAFDYGEMADFLVDDALPKRFERDAA